jgi:hypothetical protein
MKRWLYAGLFLATLTVTGCAGYYGGGYYASSPPPPMRYESYERPPGAGYVWVQGYWGYRGNNYSWVPGRWERPPHGHREWESGRWEYHGNHYQWHDGRWR